MNAKETIQELSRTHGFDLMGVSDIADPTEIRAFYQSWIDQGFMGNLNYIQKNLERRTDPRAVVPGAQSVIMFAMNYFHKDAKKPDPSKRYGRVAKYARGRDYHKVHEDIARVLIPQLEELFPENTFRFYVDYGPLAERFYAQRAGLGFVGKNCNLITKEFGSWVYLSGIITDLALEADQPGVNLCGDCTKCLDSCPTQAFAAPFVLDSRKCISYITTIKYKSNPPQEVKKQIQPWAFGCDVCQNCCPFNLRTPETTNPQLSPIQGINTHIDLEEAAQTPPAKFFERYRESVLRRWNEPPTNAPEQSTEQHPGASY